jgi:hypothetical protein
VLDFIDIEYGKTVKNAFWCRTRGQRVNNHPPLQMGELTPRRWKELFAKNPKRSVLHLIDQMRKKAE